MLLLLIIHKNIYLVLLNNNTNLSLLWVPCKGKPTFKWALTFNNILPNIRVKFQSLSSLICKCVHTTLSVQWLCH